jgi:hypothetical protein
MNNIQKRFLLFLIGCIGARLSLTYFAKMASESNLQIMGYIALIIATGFTIIYLFNLRETGGEVMGEKIWWNHLRPIHAFLFFLFAYNAINKNKDSWKILAIDTLIGLVSFLYFHKTENNFQKLFN